MPSRDLSARTAAGGLRVACALLAAAMIGPGLAACATPRAATREPTAPRTAVTLPARDAEHFRAGMRAYLEATQGIVDALASGRMPQVAASARKVGMGSVGGVSLGLIASLPPEFTLLAADTHQKFDALAEAAERKAPRKEIMEQLGAILSNCGACHAMYRLAR